MKNKTIFLWVLLVIAVLAIIGYNQGWFSKKAEVVPPAPPPTPPVNGNGTGTSRVFNTGRLPADKDSLIAYILSTKPAGFRNPTPAELAKLRSYSVPQLQLGISGDLASTSSTARGKGCAKHCILCDFLWFEPCCGHCASM